MSMTGSEIAKGGFNNEQEVADKFNNWENDKDAQQWLQIMMYNLDEIEYVKAEKIGQRGFKSDINVSISVQIKKKHLTSVEDIQVKLVSGDSGFNQVEKRYVNQYADKWHMTPQIVELLELYDGERKPREKSRDSKRMFADEFTKEEQEVLLKFFQDNLIMIISDVIRGRGRFAAEWTLVINKTQTNYRWVLLSINEAINIYAGNCKASITDRGNFRLGNITLQRKGGDGGAETANMLQFKSNPLMLFRE